MPINKIDDTYNKVISDLTSKNKRQVDSANAIVSSENSGNLAKSSLTDRVDLNPSESYTPSYLNYNSNSKYNNLPSLADFLSQDSETESTDLMSALDEPSDDQTQATDVSKYLLANSSSGSFGSSSIYDTFDTMAQDKSKEIDNLIEKTLSKMASQKSSDTSKKQV